MIETNVDETDVDVTAVDVTAVDETDRTGLPLPGTSSTVTVTPGDDRRDPARHESGRADSERSRPGRGR